MFVAPHRKKLFDTIFRKGHAMSIIYLSIIHNYPFMQDDLFAVVLLLSTFCLLLLPLWESVMSYVLLYVILCPF